MANRITNVKSGAEIGLRMSNGGTFVLVSVLLLAGSDLAESRWEKDFVAWIAEKDQSFLGLGVVGFDLDEIAWSRENFAAEKQFVLAVIDKALERHRWSQLNYDPPFVADHLKELRALVEQYQPDFVEAGKTWQFFAKLDQFTKCPVHQVFVHSHGCHICSHSKSILD
jgi:hypothetical protein